MQTGFLHEKLWSAPILFFGDTCNNFNNDQSFQLASMSLSKYKSDKILKSTDATKVTGAKMENRNMEERRKSLNEVMACKIVSVVLSTLTTTYINMQLVNVQYYLKKVLLLKHSVVWWQSKCMKDDKVTCFVID